MPRPCHFTPGKETWYPLHQRLGGTADSKGQSTCSRKLMFVKHNTVVGTLKMYIFLMIQGYDRNS